MPQEEKVTVTLPDSLRRQFEGLRDRLFSFETIFAVAFALTAILGGLLLSSISDRLWDTPPWLRLAFFVGALLGVLGAAAWWAQRWVLRPRGLREFAVLVQRKFRRLGDRLLGIVELADEANRPAYFSPELYRAAIEQVAAESAKYDFRQSANPRRMRVQSVAACSLLAVLVLVALILPEAAWNSFRRWIAPLARIPRFTLVELARLPSEQIVPHGETFRISGGVNYRSFWKPARLKLQFAGGRQLTAEASNGAFTVDVPALTADETLTIRAGDASHEVRLLARHRPAVELAGAEVELPAYLGYPPQAETAQSGILEVLEGSSLVLTGRTSRALQTAWLQPGDKAPQQITVVSNTFTTPKLPADGIGEIAMRWQDNLGLTNTAPWKLAIQTRKDAAPVPQIEEMYRDTAVLESEVIPISVRASDDYGLKMIGLNWGFEAGQEGATNAVNRRDYVQEIAAHDTKYLEHTFNFSPAVLGVPPESTLEIRAFAVDYMPGRDRSESPVYRIHVVGNAQHAEMVRQNLESLLVRLEEVTRLEEKLANDTRELKELQKLDSPEAARKIAEMEQTQQQNAAQLQEMAAEGMKDLREALRNPAFNEEVLSEWTKNLHQMEKISQQQMKEAAKSLKSAQQTPSPSAREQQLAEAQEKEEETVKALQQMQQKVNQGLDELQALTLAQRLRQISAQQKKLESTLQANIPDTIGLTPPELSVRYQKANTKLSELQNEAQAASVKIQGEISRFYERTQKPNYGEVTHEMADSKTGDELDRIKGLIQENIGMEAMQNLALWSERFETWAGKLEPKSDNKDGGGGEGGGQGDKPDDSALKQLLGLLRMREKQVGIQERTRLLHDHLDEKTAYRDGAVLLAASQSKLGRDLSKQALDNAFAILEQPYNDAVTRMSDVENLLDRPQTDQITRSAEDKSVAALTDLVNLLNEEAKKSGSSSSGKGQSSGSEDMAFLMQMMAPKPTPGMQAGQTPGGNMSGGTTDKASQAGTGDASGKSGEERSVKKSSAVPQNYPSEFREALENYFKALEEGDK